MIFVDDYYRHGIGLAAIILYVVWISYPETLTDNGVNNHIINLTDAVAAGINLVGALLALCYGILLEKETFVLLPPQMGIDRHLCC